MYYDICVMNYKNETLEHHKVNHNDLSAFMDKTIEHYDKRVNDEYIHFDIRPIIF